MEFSQKKYDILVEMGVPLVTLHRSKLDDRVWFPMIDGGAAGDPGEYATTSIRRLKAHMESYYARQGLHVARWYRYDDDAWFSGLVEAWDRVPESEGEN